MPAFLLQDATFQESDVMVIRFGPNRDLNESLISLESAVGREIQALAALFVDSSKQFLERLQSLVQMLDGQIHECLSFHGPYQFNPYQAIGMNLATHQWSPSKDFDYSAFANFASKTYEAWYIAQHRNDDVRAFNGATLQALVGLFNGIVNRPSLDAGPTVVSKIPTLFFEFQHEVVRLTGLLSLTPPKAVDNQQNSLFDAVVPVPEVIAPERVAGVVQELPFQLQRQNDPKKTDWHPDYFTVAELTLMRKTVKLPHSSTQMTREIKKEIENGRIQRDGSKPMRLRIDLHEEWSTPSE